MLDYTAHYQKYLRGKRVIFVGPAPTLVGKKTGKLIDSFDIVIRTNGAFPVKKNYVDDYGIRCDVLYINVLYAREKTLPITEYNRLGVKYLNLKWDLRNLRYKYKKNNLKIREFKSDIIQATRVIKAPPLMGQYIVYDVLKAKPKEFHITGMDCYNNPNINEHYIDGYLPARADPEKLNKTRISAHKQDIQNKYLRDMILAGKVKADEHIEKILNIS